MIRLLLLGLLTSAALFAPQGTARADDFTDLLAVVESVYGPVSPDRKVEDQTSSEWMAVHFAQAALEQRELGNIDEARRLIGEASVIAQADK